MVPTKAPSVSLSLPSTAMFVSWPDRAVAVSATAVGASLTLDTVMATACVADVLVPSVAVTVMSYTLSAPASAGASKLGEALKVTAPVVELMSNRAASAPPSV